MNKLLKKRLRYVFAAASALLLTGSGIVLFDTHRDDQKNGLLDKALNLVDPGRPLTGCEKAFVRDLFGDSINVDVIRINQGFRYANNNVTPGNHIFFANAGEVPDYALSDYDDRLIFAHELTHVWQHQNGRSTAKEALWELIAEHGHYDKAYYFDSHIPFSKMNLEQQATLVEQFYDDKLEWDRFRQLPKVMYDHGYTFDYEGARKNAARYLQETEDRFDRNYPIRKESPLSDKAFVILPSMPHPS